MSANDSDFLDIIDEENQDSHNSSNVSHRQLVLRNPGFKTPGRISSLPGTERDLRERAIYLPQPRHHRALSISGCRPDILR